MLILFYLPAVSPRRFSLPGSWRNTFGNLIETCWFEQNLSRASIYWHVPETAEGYGFVEFEISNCTISTVSRQPLICRFAFLQEAQHKPPALSLYMLFQGLFLIFRYWQMIWGASYTTPCYHII